MNEGHNSEPLIQDLLTVIIPVYNCEKYLHQCIDSILNQSHDNFELILIDDGSLDASREICDVYARLDNRIRVIHTKNNGPAAARNIGIENSKGRFIFFADADDFISHNALELLIEKCNYHQVDMVVGDFVKIRDHTSDVANSGHDCFFSGGKLLNRPDIYDYARQYLKKPNRFPLFAYSWGRLFRSSLIKKNKIAFDIDLYTFEDVAFNFHYLKYTHEIFFLKEIVYYHRIQHNYASTVMRIGSNPKRLLGYRQALANINYYLTNCVHDADLRKEVGHAYVCLTIIQLVRVCGQINKINKKSICALIHEIVNESQLRDSLRFYSPTEGDSRVLPILMKLRLVLPVLLICKYKAHRRYGT